MTARKTATAAEAAVPEPTIIPEKASEGAPVTPVTPPVNPASQVITPDAGVAYASVPAQPTEEDLRTGVTPDDAAVPPVEEPEAEEPATADRIETYKATRPNGEVVTVEHNLDKGTTKIV